MGKGRGYDPEPWCSWFMPLVALACVGMFAFEMYRNDCPHKSGDPDRCIWYDVLGRYSFQPFSENNFLGPSVDTLRELGGLDRKLVLEKDQKWRLLSCMWLHVGVIHLVANTLSILLVGVRLEEEFGFLRIGVLYVACGAGGSLMSCLTANKEGVSAGASGAIFGLLGSCVSELMTNWQIYQNKCGTLISLILMIGLNFLIGLLPHVDNSAHLGGFIAGFFIGFVLLLRPYYGYVVNNFAYTGYELPPMKASYRCHQYVFWVIGLVGTFLIYAVGVSRLLQGKTFESTPLTNLN